MKWICTTANFVAAEINYCGKNLLEQWGYCHQETVKAFQGSSFAHKFEKLLTDIKDMGFGAIELWVGHLEPESATIDRLKQARSLLDRHEIEVVSYTAGFGEPNISRETVEKAFQVASSLEAKLLVQSFHPSNREIIEFMCEKFGIRFAYENHPERNANEVLERIHPANDWIGACADTGWFATQKCDPVTALEELKPSLLQVHLKDIHSPGEHLTCALGDGIVPVRSILKKLKAWEFNMCVIEHTPIDYNPSRELRQSLRRVTAWWQEIEQERHEGGLDR